MTAVNLGYPVNSEKAPINQRFGFHWEFLSTSKHKAVSEQSPVFPKKEPTRRKELSCKGFIHRNSSSPSPLALFMSDFPHMLPSAE